MATPNIKPRGNNEGELGILGRLWAKVWVTDIHVAGNITDGTNSVTVADLMSTTDDELTHVITPPELTANANNYEPTGWATSHMVRQAINLNNRSISGLKAPSPPSAIIKRIHNLSQVDDLKFLHDDGGSDPENRIYLRDANDKSIKPNETAEFWYDVIDEKYKPLNRIG